MGKKQPMDLNSAVQLILDSEEDSVPKEIYSDPNLYLSLISKENDYTAMRWLANNYMPSALKSDKSLMLQLIKNDAQVYECVEGKLKNDAELYQIAIDSNVDLFEYAGDSLKTDKKIVADFLKKWLKEKKGSLLPLAWVPTSLANENKFIEQSNVKSMPPKDGQSRFVIYLVQEEVSEKKADSVLAKQESFVQALIKDKKAELFNDIIQIDNSEDEESVETYAYVYIKGATLEDLDAYFNALAAKKVSGSSTTIYDVENPNYMNYQDGEVSSGSIGFDEYEDGADVYKTMIERRHLNSWPIKLVDLYK